MALIITGLLISEVRLDGMEFLIVSAIQKKLGRGLKSSPIETVFSRTAGLVQLVLE